MELLKDRPQFPELITRRYPVKLKSMRERLYQDLQSGVDAVFHLGQAPGSTQVKLEAIAVNAAGLMDNSGEELAPVEQLGPVAYRSPLPLGRWAQMLREQQIPAAVSYHAGTFLCNATLYSSLHLSRGMSPQPLVGFFHLPLSTQQVAKEGYALASMDVRTMATAIRLMLIDLATNIQSLRGSTHARELV